MDPSAKDMSTLNWDVGLARHAQLTAEENLVAIVQGIHKEMMEKVCYHFPLTTALSIIRYYLRGDGNSSCSFQIFILDLLV